jgi:LysR family transcriptional regulator, glycine cleavage system transcriptional activator
VHPKIDLKKLPPLKALKGFEAATRHQSIRDAADELCLTHPAVSHQVQLIEDALGVTLFAQEGRHIVSTEEGKVLYPYVRAAFESLLEGVEEVHRNALDKPLRVQTYVTASIRWLAKRVPQFLADHPEIKLTLSTCAVEWEFDDVHADVGLVYCETIPDPAKFHWVPLYEYALFPVCSPEVAKAMGKGATAQDLMTKPLVAIYTEVQNWETWFVSAGAKFEPSVPYLMVDTLAVALEMALNGEGIALVNGPFVDQDLAAGRLVQPIAHKAICPGAWGLICRKDMRENLRIRTFMDWVIKNVEAARPSAAN